MSENNIDKIILLAKNPGLTSFGSLRNVKKALGTQKVGHTGTLDSFACGLLVVCAGHLTKLCGQITASDKIYEAVIHFGKETDTCEYTGDVLKEAPLPTEEDFLKALKKWTGKVTQVPPVFSAVHVDGKRASDLVREGKEIDLPSRDITVFASKVINTKKTPENLVEYAHVEFHVSKGTYIRSLARDIARDCGSAAHLTGLCRTKVGLFELKDACGFNMLLPFGIDSSISEESRYFDNKKKETESGKKSESFDIEKDLYLQNEIKSKSLSLDVDLCKWLGFEHLQLKNEKALLDFQNGRQLKSNMFDKSLWDFAPESQIAVFYGPQFYGLITKNAEGRIKYDFVIHK